MNAIHVFVFLCMLIVSTLPTVESYEMEQTVKSRQLEECTRRLRLVMRFECRLLPDEFCLPFSYDMDYSQISGKELLQQKCCTKRCSLRTLRTLCCFQ